MGKHLPGRPSSTARGYGRSHRNLRRQWAPHVEAGGVECSAPLCMVEQGGGSRRIAPTAPWDLGHDETDRRRYAGPQHQECNRGQSRRSPTRVTPALDPAAPFDPGAWGG
jgi:hypothetical protein